MASLSKLNDKQNMLLTQFSYHSHVLEDDYNGMTLEAIREILVKRSGEDNKEACAMLDELIAADLGDLKIKDVCNDYDTGFGAIAFTDDKGNTGFSYRGTDGIKIESLNDWGDNVNAMFTGTSAQTVQAEAFFDKNKDKSGDNFLYGHSKGGELSESVYANNYSDIEGVHLLNPQPLNPYSLAPDQLVAMQSDKVDIIIVEGDYVWFLGRLPSYGNIRIVEKVDGENAHLYDAVTFDKNGNIVEGKMPWWEYGAYFLITSITGGWQLMGSTFGYVYNTLVRVYDFVTEDLYSKAKEYMIAAAEKAKEIWSSCLEFAHELGEFLGKTADRVRDWLNENFNYGYGYAADNPQITLDTYKLRSYAQRLEAVNRRVYNLDGRLDALYWKVGLLDLWNLIQADLLTSYSLRLLSCSNYLNDTASEFESVETDLLSKL